MSTRPSQQSSTAPVDALTELEDEVAQHLPERDKGPFRGDDALRHATWLLRRYRSAPATSDQEPGR